MLNLREQINKLFASRDIANDQTQPSSMKLIAEDYPEVYQSLMDLGFVKKEKSYLIDPLENSCAYILSALNIRK